MRILDLSGTSITDDGLSEIVSLTKLERVCLPQTLITDAGLRHLKGLGNLQYLDLEAIPMTDAGLECIKGLTSLRSSSGEQMPVGCRSKSSGRPQEPAGIVDQRITGDGSRHRKIREIAAGINPPAMEQESMT